MTLSIATIKPRTGSNFPLGKLTVLVGPNNSGKSQTLRDIRQFVTSGEPGRMRSLESIEVKFPTLAEALQYIRLVPDPINVGHVKLGGVKEDLRQRDEITVTEDWPPRLFAESDRDDYRKQLLLQLGRFWLAHLDARGRFELTAQTEAYDVRREAPNNALQKFYELRELIQPRLRAAFQQAFGSDIALDWAAMRMWNLRVGEAFGSLPEENKALFSLLENSESLSSQGDGYNSFAGVMLALLTFPERLLLLDEPEAFLHPAQARILGRQLAENAALRAGQVVVATHNADFLWGILSSGADVNVVRLNRSDSGVAYHPIAPATMADLARSPLLSSQPVLDALFHKGVVVCEGDSDRAIYQAVGHGMADTKIGTEVLFLHTNGKGAAKHPLQLLRMAGTPVCAIVDLDIISSAEPLTAMVVSVSGSEPPIEVLQLQRMLAAAVEEAAEGELIEALIQHVEEWKALSHESARAARRALIDTSQKALSKWEVIKERGVDYFAEPERVNALEFLLRLEDLNIFAVPCGELERWFDLDLAKGKEWNRAALERLHRGECPKRLSAFISRVIARFDGPPSL